LPPRGDGNNNNGRFQNNERQFNRQPFVPKPRFDEQNIDMESNFRKYYFKDRQFYVQVMQEENPGENGYKFKIHVFQKSEDEQIAKE